MFDSVKVRLALIAAVSLLSVWLIAQRGITLGLDLQGGTHLALEVSDPANAMTAAQRADATDRALQIIRTRIDELGVAEPAIQKVGSQRIIVELPGATQEEQQRAKDVIQQAAFLQFQIVRPLSEIEGALPRIDRAVRAAEASGALESLPTSTAEPAAPSVVGDLFEQTAAADSAAADSADTTLAAATDTAVSARPFSSRLIPTGALGQIAVADAEVPALERYLALPEVQRLLPRDVELVWGASESAQQAQGYQLLYLLEQRPIMTGEHLVDAQALRDPQLGQPIVSFQLSRRGGRVFEQATGQHVGDFMAIVLDDRVITAPIINSQISTNGQIELGGGSIEEARDLALVLRAGALPAPIQIVEERSVGPSLGADSVEQGGLAGLIAIGLVIFVLVGYYRFSGVLAVGALALYVLFILGALAGIDATLTLPGIAGIVLSVGMSVDANVLIFERIREELDAGRSPRVAVSEGFSNALSAIVDGQLTTLLTALVLFQFGTGPVRGFAVTLGIGIIASLFSAIFITRTFYMLYLDRLSPAQGLSV